MANDSAFWDKVHQIASKAVWAYLATVDGDQPRVRVVHPAWEGHKLWVATGPESPKVRQIKRNPRVELFYQVGPDFQHLTVTGEARFVEDQAEKNRIWNGKVFDYELSQFWPEGPTARNFGLLLVTPGRVELTSLTAAARGQKPEVWRAK